MFKPVLRTVAAFIVAGVVASPIYAQDLMIIFDDLGSDKKAAFDAAVDKFKEENPDMEVQVSVNERDAHKTAIRNFLSADPPDVTAWYPGNRMAPFVNAGQFEPITDLWKSEGLDKTFASIEPTMSMNGEVWGVPYSYYQWGLYYRADLLEEMGVEPPENWEDLLAACATVKEGGKECITTGTKALWPAAGIFDYLNLRTNGYDFHNKLTAGEAKYTSDEVRQVFTHWSELIEPGYIVSNHATMDWQEALSLFNNGGAVFYVIGNFAIGPMLDGGLTEEQIGYVPFPTINPDVERAEDAPADAFFIPSGAKNKENAKKFLAFVARADVQTEWNKAINQLPPNSEATPGDNKFLNAGFETLSTAAGLAQFYDRDASAEMAKAGMEGFQEFMIKPDRIDQILERLDKIQSRLSK